MHRKCNPLTNDFYHENGALQPEKSPAWHILNQASPDVFILCRTKGTQVLYSPLFLHSFVLCAPRRILDATRFNQRCRRYEEIDNVPDRLQWCRHSKGLMQSEVAAFAGMSESMYRYLEKGQAQYVPAQVADRLAQLYQVPVSDFLDEFSRFLYDGQADRIRRYRERLGMEKRQFAEEMGIPIRSLQEWEKETKTISLKCWERHFKGKA